MATVRHALKHLLGMNTRLWLVASVMQGQHPQAVRAQRQQRVAMQAEAVEMFALLQRHPVVAATEIDRQMPGYCAQLAGDIRVGVGQLAGVDKSLDGLRGGAPSVITGTAQSQFQSDFQVWAGFVEFIQQMQRPAHVAAVFLE